MAGTQLRRACRRRGQEHRLANHYVSDLVTGDANLGKLRYPDHKVIVYVALADDSIPPAGDINYYERVAAAMGGYAETQKF